MELEYLINHTKTSILNAYSNISNLSAEILSIEGMTGNKTRHLYNNICDLKDANYLEVGTWKGSSFIAAMHNNLSTKGYCIDNWSEFNGPKEEYYKNIKKYLNQLNNIITIDKDCWAITNEDIKDPIDIFMYDGFHSYECQKKAITYYHQFFSKYVIIIIDDWTCDWVDVKKGTIDGINEMKLKIHYSYELPLVNTLNHHTGGDTFWNGCGIFICEKTI